MAISPQLPKYSEEVVNKNKLTFPVLSDKDNGYATQLKLDFVLEDSLKGVYNGFGIDLAAFNGNESWVLPMTGRLIVDSKGVIRNIEVNPNHTVRPEPTEIIDIIKSMS